MNILTDVPMAGRFRIVARKLDADGNEVSSRVCADWFSNLITNVGMDMVANDQVSQFAACQVGSSSQAPAFTDTGLVSRVAGTITIQGTNYTSASASPYFKAMVRTFRFATGVAAGNLSEVGVGPAVSGNVYSRALIKDGSGNPTTITILADETLDVIYEHRWYVPETDAVDVFNIEGVDYTVTLRAALATATIGASNIDARPTMGRYQFDIGLDDTAIGAITSAPGGANNMNNFSKASSQSYEAYVTGNHYVDETYTWGLSAGNISVVSGAALAGEAAPHFWQWGFSPALPKDNTKVLTMTFRHSWSRYAGP